MWLLKINERDRDTGRETKGERGRQGYKERQKELGRSRQRRQIWRHGRNRGYASEYAGALNPVAALNAVPDKEYGRIMEVATATYSIESLHLFL